MHNSETFHGASLCVVGNINRDVKTAPFEAGSHLFEDGETSLDFIYETAGGGAAHSALAARILGADVALVSKVGKDALGERLERHLQKYGVKPFLARDGKNASGTSLNLVYTSGSRHFASCLPTAASFAFEDVNPAALDGADHLLRGDIWFSSEMLFGGNERLFKLAKSRGLATSIDLNWDPQMGHATPETLRTRRTAVRTILPLVDLVHGNVRELTAFTEDDTIDAALHHLEEWGAGAVVLHHGKQGSGFFSGGKLIIEPAAPTARSVNATGTGDVLSVCMMLLHKRTDLSIPEKLRMSNKIVAGYIEGRQVLAPVLE